MAMSFFHWIFLRSKHISNLLSIVSRSPSLWVKWASETVSYAPFNREGMRGNVWKWLSHEIIARVWRRGWGLWILAYSTAMIPLVWRGIQCSLNLHCFVFADFYFFTKCTSFDSLLPGLFCFVDCYHLIGKVINQLIGYGALWYHLIIKFLFKFLML